MILESLISKINKKKTSEINETKKLIIAYGIAKTLQILHNNKIILRNLNTSNIVLDSDYYPYITDFSLSIQAELRPSYLICEDTLKNMKTDFIAPEFKTKEPISTETSGSL